MNYMLSDRDLQMLALTQDIVIPFDPKNCEGATINLTLGTTVRKYVSNETIILGKEVSEQHYSNIDISNEDFELKPGESVLIHTHEFVKVPNHLSARIYERYGVKSLGLMISPAHYMNPGYRGNIGLLAVNHSPVPVKLIPGIKICQLALFELSSEPLKPYEKQDGKYMDAQTASISKLHLDKEIQEFLELKGVKKVSDDMASELGEYLMGHIRTSAKRLADILRAEEGIQKNE
jgi:dCTP deaminase